MGTFSKAIAPAIRVSYMVLPQTLLKAYNEKLSSYSCTVSRIDQAILSEFLKKGHFERHLNRMRALYKSKNQFLIQQLKIFGKNIKIMGSSAGLHILVEFQGLKDHRKFQDLLLKNGIKMQAISNYYIEGKPEKECYILGFARLKESQIAEGILQLKEVYDELTGNREK